jgi:hypothetical protein
MAAVSACSAASVTYSFTGVIPTLDGSVPSSFILQVSDFIDATPPVQFTGSDFQSCSAPGTGACIAQFSIGPSPVSGLSDEIGFGNNNCCFIYFFPENSFSIPGTYTADPFHSAGTATLTVSTVDTPEPATLRLALLPIALLLLEIRRRSRSYLRPQGSWLVWREHHCFVNYSSFIEAEHLPRRAA